MREQLNPREDYFQTTTMPPGHVPFVWTVGVFMRVSAPVVWSMVNWEIELLPQPLSALVE
jgi:hypothetical protein